MSDFGIPSPTGVYNPTINLDPVFTDSSVSSASSLYGQQLALPQQGVANGEHTPVPITPSTYGPITQAQAQELYGYNPNPYAGFDYMSYLSQPGMANNINLLTGDTQSSLNSHLNLTAMLNGYEAQVNATFGQVNINPSGLTNSQTQSISSIMSTYKDPTAVAQLVADSKAAVAEEKNKEASGGSGIDSELFNQFLEFMMTKEGFDPGQTS